MAQVVHDQQYLAGAHTRIQVADSVVQLGDTANLITKQLVAGAELHKATGVWVEPRSYPIYYTLDGTAPATDGSTGHLLSVGDILDLKGWQNIKNFKAIRVGANTAYIMVTPFFNSTGGWAG